MISSPVRRRLAWAAILALAGTVLSGCYLLQSRTSGTASDGAAISLQAWDMLHGNWLLHGWWLSDVSFYTTELPEYALVEAARGLRPDVVHCCGALTYTLLVLTTALMARGPARGREGTVRALLAGGIMVAPAFGYASNVLLESPDHTGTGVPIMLILLLLDRARPRWYLPWAVLVLLAWVQTADLLATYAAAIPIALVCAARVGWRRLRRDARTAAPKPAWYDLSLAVAAVASIPLANVAVAFVHTHSGFYVNPVPGPLFASTAALPAQARALGQCVLMLFGADFIGQSGVWAGFAFLHMAGVVLAGLGLLAGIRGFFGRLDRVSQILVAGTLTVLGAALFGTHMSNIFSTHEIAVVLPFGAALAGRLLGAGVIRTRLEPALAVVLAGYLAALGFTVTQPAVLDKNQALAGWLLAHHLHDGLAGYWQADSVTLESGGKVRLAPVFGPSLDHPGGGRVWLLIVLVSVFDFHVRFPCAGGVRGLPGRAQVRTGSDRAGMASFRVAGVVRAGHAGAGRAEMRCQQVMNAVFHGQSRLIFRVRRRAWRTSRAGTCHNR